MNQKLIDHATEKLRLASKMSEQYYGKSLKVAYSGGKDSDVLLALARMSGVKYDVYNAHTTVDAPETVYHIRSVFEEERLRGGIHQSYIRHTRVSQQTCGNSSLTRLHHRRELLDIAAQY